MKRYRQQEFSPDVTLPMLKSENGDWVRYEDAAARIAELEAEIVERRKDYSACIRDQDARIAELEAQLAAAQELAASYRNALMAAEATNDN
jgi:hypothetical protein